MMKRQQRILKTDLADPIREAVRRSNFSLVEIGRLAEMSPSALSRFLSKGGGISLPTFDRLVDVLRLELVPRKRQGLARRKPKAVTR